MSDRAWSWEVEGGRWRVDVGGCGVELMRGPMPCLRMHAGVRKEHVRELGALGMMVLAG